MLGWLLLAYFVILNIGAYLVYASDKARSIKGGYRVSEQKLLILAALGGSIGAIAARIRLRHKTRKQPFADMLLLTVGLQLGATIGVSTLLLMVQFR